MCGVGASGDLGSSFHRLGGVVSFAASYPPPQRILLYSCTKVVQYSIYIQEEPCVASGACELRHA